MTAHGTKRRDAEFAKKNAEMKEELIEKILSVCPYDLSDCSAVR